MNDREHDTKGQPNRSARDDRQAYSSERVPYEKPALQVLGSVTELTLGGTSGTTDGARGLRT